MPEIIPIKDLKNTAEISEKCPNSDEPIFITKNGYGDMVIMSIEVYENSLKRLNIYRELLLSESQIENGETKEARQSLISLKKKYSL